MDKKENGMGRQMSLLLTLVAVLLVGCNSGFKNQDPMDGQPDNIKRAIPPEKKTDSPADDVLPEESLQIDADVFYEFIEGEEREIEISSRALLPDTTYTLELDNADRRLDAVSIKSSEDGHKQTLTWTPPKGWVGDQSVRRVRVTAILNAKRGKTYLSRRQEIQIVVYREDVGPEIVEVVGLPEDGLREGGRAAFTVLVRDPESVSRTTPVIGTPPQLRLVETSKDNSLVPFLEQDGEPTRSEEDPELWTFKMKIDINNEHNLTHNADTHYFGLKAVNRHAVPSTVTKENLSIRSSLAQPLISWSNNDPVIFTEGKENYFSFTVFDPLQEGKATLEWVTDWKKEFPGLLITCKEAGYNKDYDCLLAWTPENLENFELPKMVELEFKTKNQSTTHNDEFSQDRTEKRKILIQKNGHPPILSELDELTGANLHNARIKADNTPTYEGRGGY